MKAMQWPQMHIYFFQSQLNEVESDICAMALWSSHLFLHLPVMFQLEVFPGTDRNYVKQVLKGFLINSTLDQALHRTMDYLLENPPQPVEQTPEVTVGELKCGKFFCYHFAQVSKEKAKTVT